ncbi:N-acetylglucosamine kinase [Photobacterium rosenbergii]|uniref:N-acetylglucosamine kinase n=1 Tax=Photobacterium rosenbergii TaxID=294936 RepID=A0A2T3NFH6_9GAMM|nr:NACHT domain-containing protein [Photobacterium rosenbergii]PSW13338.1 N-acetylglucosamine kinase [Photobacterium rosenbergii]
MISEFIATEGLKFVLTELSSYLRDKASHFRTQDLPDLEAVYQRAIKVEDVKTIWQIDKTVNLNEFYYPSKLKFNNSVLDVENLSSFPPKTKIVIQGTAGQGKSILLRYLAGKEIRHGSKIPLFIELRKVTKRQPLESLIIDSVKSIGIDVDSSSLEELFKSGKIVLLLDAFDELQEDLIIDSLSYIEVLSVRHQDLKIIITSRPDAEIQKVASFSVCQLKPLSASDFKPLLNKFYSNDPSEVDIIIKSIHESDSGISELLTTPLLLTLLTITYKSYNKIPEKPHEFYEKLFHVLINRHDATKPGFKRDFKSNLNEKQLEDLFCAFSFYCMLDKKTSLTNTEALHLISKASTISSLDSVNESCFLTDCIKNTCLIVQEGFEYHYIHKSIREYHAASFIKNSPLELKGKFYKVAISNNKYYQQELNFLKVIDEHYFNNLFLIPSYEYIYEILNWDGEKINPDASLFDNVEIKFNMNKLSSIHVGSLSVLADSYFPLSTLIFPPIFQVFLKDDNFETEESSIQLRDLEDNYGFIEKTIMTLNQWVIDSQTTYQSAKQQVNVKKDIISSLTF